jgi:hypothetical protein
VTVAGLSPLTRSSDRCWFVVTSNEVERPASDARSRYELACKAGSQRWLSPYELVSFLAGVSIGCYLRAPRELVRRAHSAEFHHRSCDIQWRREDAPLLHSLAHGRVSHTWWWCRRGLCTMPCLGGIAAAGVSSPLTRS